MYLPLMERLLTLALCAVALCAVMALLSCGGGTADGLEEELEVYDVRGEVMDLRENNVVLLKHEDIGGWMEAMTMEFPVKDAEEFAKLAKGDSIECKIYVRGLDYHLAEIQVVPPPEE